jgi:flagellar assembly protein FliH
MLSKVLIADQASVQPVEWRRGSGSSARSARPISAGDPDEIFKLRARIAELTATAEQQARQAYETGMRAGEGAARKSLESATRAAIDRVTATAAEIDATRSEAIQRAEADTVRLAIEIARRVLHRELTVDPNALQALTREALRKLQSQEIQRLRVHPDQEKMVRASLEESGRGRRIEVLADPSQPPGGIVFDVVRGTLDASVGTQLDEIVRGLTDRLEGRP